MWHLSLSPRLDPGSMFFVLVTQSCLTLCDPVDCSLPGSSIHGIFQARSLEWTAISFSMSLLFNMPSRLVITFLPRSQGYGFSSGHVWM